MPKNRIAPRRRLSGSWGRNLGLLGVVGSAGVAATVALANGTPTLVSVLAAAGAAAGLLSLAAAPSPRRTLPRTDAPPRVLHFGPPASSPNPTGEPRIGVRTTTWPLGRALRLRADRADETYFAAPATPTAPSIWESWEPAVGELPIGLVGPVPETFVPLEATPASGVFDVGGPAFVLPTLAAVAPPVTSSLAPTPLDTEDIAFTDIELEALTPIPPHLRAFAPVPAAISDTEVLAPAETRCSARGRCASCRRAVVETPNWRRCPECHAALCAACSVRALKTQARAWCTLCAPLYVAD